MRTVSWSPLHLAAAMGLVASMALPGCGAKGDAGAGSGDTGDASDTHVDSGPTGDSDTGDSDTGDSDTEDSGGTDDTSCTSTTWYRDADGDGYGTTTGTAEACVAPEGYVAASGDCDDADANVRPGAPEYCDGIDQDCDGQSDDEDALDTSHWWVDADGDGFGASGGFVLACTVPAGTVGNQSDCDDARADVNPDAEEVCDEADVDEDCDRLANDRDDDVQGESAWWPDQDGDGLGAAGPADWRCDAPRGYVANGDDCDDAEPRLPSLFALDADGDGFGGTTFTGPTCTPAAGYIHARGDCDDGDPAIHPGAADTDCEGTVDVNCDGSSGMSDVDGDGYPACEDCNDHTSTISPAAVELCDGVDEDCDGVIDDDATDAVPWYQDADGDEYGDDATVVYACTHPAHLVPVGGDCDDTVHGAHPGAAETCTTSFDDDCNGQWNEVGARNCTYFYQDVDGDGYSLSGYSCQCAADEVWTASATSGVDCDDGQADIHPGATDVCEDGIDADCNDSDVCNAVPSGVVLYGDGATAFAGCSVAAADDVTGDGIPDFLVGSEEWSGGRGAAYLVSGATSADARLTDSVATLTGASGHSWAGWSVAGGEDFDGDGVSDVVVGAPYEGIPSKGAVAVVVGPVSGSIDLGSARTTFTGANDESMGWELAAFHDLTGDGTSDVVIGSYGWSRGQGRVLVGDALIAGTIAADTLPTQLTGTAGTGNFGSAVLDAGDLDGDGVEDLAVGAMAASEGAARDGAVYLYQGPLSGAGTAADADGVLFGGRSNLYAGKSLAAPGDIDGDGHPDLAIGSFGGWGNVWLVTTGIAGRTALTSSAVSFEGDGSAFGETLALGDFDGDGAADVAIGGDLSSFSIYAGGEVVLFPNVTAGAYTIDDATLLLAGPDYLQSLGSSLLSPGDLDADGCDDLVIGAEGQEDPSGTRAGGAWIISGCGLW